MLNKAWFIIFLCIFCLGDNLLAQKQEFSFKQNSAVSLNLSTLGVGAAFHLKYNDAVAFRAGFSKGNIIFQYNTSYSNKGIGTNGTSTYKLNVYGNTDITRNFTTLGR